MKKYRVKALLVLSLISPHASFAATSLTSGQSVSDSVAKGSWKYYQISASSNSTVATVDISDLTSDVDLYVKKGSQPTFSNWDCRPYLGGTSSENCSLTLSSAATIQIGVHGYSAGSYSITATISGQSSSGFNLIKSASGVSLYQKNYSGGSPDYVQIVDLSQGASVELLHGQITDYRHGYGVYGGDDPKITRQSLDDAWSEISNDGAFCITNGQFFSTNNNPTTLAFPLKVNGEVVSEGYGIDEPFDKMTLEIWSDRARIRSYSSSSDLYDSTAPNIIVGLSEHANKSINSHVGRTFVGVDDTNSDGKHETILIFNSKYATQPEAASVLREFGADEVLMFDGGGSSQLICDGQNYVSSSRTIPQTIATFEANDSDAIQYVDRCINTFSSYFGSKTGSVYTCYSNYYCQDTTGDVSKIAIHKELSGNEFYYYWGGWNSLSLDYCQ